MNFDFQKHPFLVLWELTRACDLACRHCRAEAKPQRDPRELNTQEAFAVIDEIGAFDSSSPILLVLTGGDPVKRPDLFAIISYAHEKGLRVTITPSGTPLLQFEDIVEMKNCGVSRIAVSLDASNRKIHDTFRGVMGSFDWTQNILNWAEKISLEKQINTTLNRYNLHDFDALVEVCRQQNIALWSVFFLVPTGRGSIEDALSAQECETIFQKMVRLKREKIFDIKSTAAPQFRRVLIQEQIGKGLGFSDDESRAPTAVNDGNGLVFISHTGEIFPSGFLPLSAGNIRKESLVSIYQNSPLFRSLRDYSQLKGKCGVCEFRNLCGGSRARAHALSQDYLESDPSCAYIPSRLKKMGPSLDGGT